MPNTKISWGSSSSSNEDGTISLKGRDSEARFSFTDKKGHKTYAQIKVYELSELKKTKLYNEAQSYGAETLVHHWFFKQSKTERIIYSGSQQLAFVYTSTGPIDEDLRKLRALKNLYPLYALDYFNEAEFCRKLHAECALDSAKLRVLSRTQARMDFFFQQSSALFALVKLGFKIEHLALVEEQRLKAIFAAAEKMEAILKLLSFEQVLGLDNKPLDLSAQPLVKLKADEVIMSSGYADDFYYAYSSGNLAINYLDEQGNTKASRQFFFGTLIPTLRAEYKEKTQNKECEHLVHDWYYLAQQFDTSKQQQQTSLYCPALEFIVHDRIDVHFPTHQLPSICLQHITYYKEREFALFLQQNGYELEAYRKLPGVSQSKLELLCTGLDKVKELMKMGLGLADFAEAEELRLTHVLNYYPQASAALEFVNVFSLLNLKQASSPRERLGFFTQAEDVKVISSKEEKPQPKSTAQSSSCSLM